MKIQPIEFIQANNLGFEEGNAVKYICRWKNKNGVQDLEKAIHYIQLLIEKHKKDEQAALDRGHDIRKEGYQALAAVVKERYAIDNSSK